MCVCVCVCVYTRERKQVAVSVFCKRENTLPFQRERKKPSVDRRGRYPAEAPMCHGRLVKT